MKAQFECPFTFEMATIRQVAFRYILHLNYNLSCIYLKSPIAMAATLKNKAKVTIIWVTLNATTVKLLCSTIPAM